MVVMLSFSWMWWILLCSCMCIFVLSVESGLLSSSILGLVISVCVSVICCCCFLESWCGN